VGIYEVLGAREEGLQVFGYSGVQVLESGGIPEAAPRALSPGDGSFPTESAVIEERASDSPATNA
jgi:hypothetical protein